MQNQAATARRVCSLQDDAAQNPNLRCVARRIIRRNKLPTHQRHGRDIHFRQLIGEQVKAGSYQPLNVRGGDQDAAQKTIDFINQMFVPLYGALQGKIVLGENVSGGIVEIRVTAQDPWVPAVLGKSWRNFSDTNNKAAAIKGADGRVSLRGVISGGTPGNTDAANAWTLPAGYRPAQVEVLACASNSAFGAVAIFPDGRVRPTTGSGTWFSLDGLSFAALDPSPAPNPALPVKVSHGVVRPVKSVVVAKCEILSASGAVQAAVPTSVMGVDWTEQGDMLLVRNLPGLTPGAIHRIYLLVLGT